MIESLLVVIECGQRVLGQHSCSFDECHVVEQVECLEWRVGSCLPNFAGLAAGGVEVSHHWRRDGSLPVGIEAAAVQVRPMILLVRCVRSNFLEQTIRLIRPYRRSSDFLSQHSAGQQSLITNHLGRQSGSRSTRQQPIVGIDIPAAAFRLSGSRTLSVGAAHHDRFDQPLDVPPGFHELNRQPVQQFRMTRPLALYPEVFGCFDDARSKDISPEPVDDDASCQRVVTTDQPPSQSQAIRRSIFRQRWQRRWHTKFDPFPWSIILTSQEHTSLTRRPHFLHDHGRWQRTAKFCKFPRH